MSKQKRSLKCHLMTIAFVFLTQEERERYSIRVPLILWVDLFVLYLFTWKTNLFDIFDNKTSCIAFVLAVISEEFRAISVFRCWCIHFVQ